MQTGTAVGGYLWRICGLASVWTMTAFAQATEMWIWLDDNNRRVLSDRPPPASVPAQRVLRAPAPQPVPAPSPPAQASSPPQPGLMSSPQDIRADNCKRAQASLAQLQTAGQLLMHNEQGQPVIMDAAMKRAERARLRQIIRDNCR